MKKVFAIAALILFSALSYHPVLATNVKELQTVKEECVKDEDVLVYVRNLGYPNPVIIDQIGCDRIVESRDILIYVYVAGGRIVGAEIIGN